MAKIRISESKLRQLIGESVVSVLNEANNSFYTYQPPQYNGPVAPQAQPQRVKPEYMPKTPEEIRGISNLKQLQKSAQRYEKTWEELTQDEKNFYGNSVNYNGRRQDAINRYNKAIKKYGAGKYAQEAATAQNNLNAANAEIDRLNREVQAKNSAIQAIYNVAGIGRNPAPNQAKALENIGRWKRAANQWYNYQKQLKSQQAQNTANTTTNTVASNTTQTTAENQRGYSEA